MDIRALLENAGFAEGFVLPVAPYTNWTRHRQDGVFHPNTAPLADDPGAVYPWANAVLICVLPYMPKRLRRNCSAHKGIYLVPSSYQPLTNLLSSSTMVEDGKRMIRGW